MLLDQERAPGRHERHEAFISRKRRAVLEVDDRDLCARARVVDLVIVQRHVAAIGCCGNDSQTLRQGEFRRDGLQDIYELDTTI